MEQPLPTERRNDGGIKKEKVDSTSHSLALQSHTMRGLPGQGKEKKAQKKEGAGGPAHLMRRLAGVEEKAPRKISE